MLYVNHFSRCFAACSAHDLIVLGKLLDVKKDAMGRVVLHMLPVAVKLCVSRHDVTHVLSDKVLEFASRQLSNKSLALHSQALSVVSASCLPRCHCIQGLHVKT